jgi:CheY-like chemotaxis protein
MKSDLIEPGSAINQQIATKTILKLGFKVTAAWNGKEALEYLAAAREGNRKKPDIILMDVQMPLVDGYKCTHVLRHHLAYKAFIRDVPIVAMTASAIQGDKEKCQRAGMDDYLAKPVKSKTLERMLVRWSLNPRQPRLGNSEPSISDCSELGEHCKTVDMTTTGAEEMEIDPDGAAANLRINSSGKAGVQLDDQLNMLTPPLLPRDEQQRIDDKSLVGEPSRVPPPSPHQLDPQPMRRSGNEELAMHVQVEKLIDAATSGTSKPRGTPSTPEVIPGSALTHANMERLERESR